MIGDRMMAGHRVLRLAGRGERSQVWLAEGGRVLKVIPAPFAAGQPAGEIEALDRAAGDHVIELLDVSLDDTAAMLVFPRLPMGSLAQLLAQRSSLDAGEAVTVLAPIATALSRLHGAGVAHGDLSSAHILFRGDGAPMLIGFGSAQVFTPGLPEVQLERQPGVIGDRAALAALSAAVLTRVDGPRSAAAAALAQSLGPGASSDLVPRLERELFELAAARPILTQWSEEPVRPTRVVAVTDMAEPVDDGPAPGAGRNGLRADAARLLTSALERGPGSVLRARLRALWAGWSPARRRAVVAGSAAAVALLAALTAIPSSDQGTAVPAAEPTAPADAVGDTGVDASAVTGDDPLAALAALLERRQECFRELSVLCLDTVAEQGSSALQADREALGALLDSGASPPVLTTDGARLVERMGDSALIALEPGSDPASILLLRSEAGWRIRDYLTQPSPAATGVG